MGKTEDPYALVIRMQGIRDTVAKRYGESSKHGKLELPYAAATPLLGITRKNQNQDPPERSALPWV